MAEPEKKSSKKIIVIIGFVLLVVGSGVAAYFLAPKLTGSEPKEAKEVATEGGAEKVASKPKKVKVIIPIKTLVVNVKGGSGRFLKVGIEMEGESKEVEAEAKESMAEIRDQLITILTTKNTSEIVSTEGKRKIKLEIIRKANKILKSGKIKKVYFTDFVMQ